MQERLFYILTSLAIVTLIGSCMATSHGASGENKYMQLSTEQVLVAQIIIKFKNANTNPTETAFLKKLSCDVKATLQYLRPLAGGAHVFRVVSTADNKHLSAIIQGLSKRADIVYVEEDANMVHQ